MGLPSRIALRYLHASKGNRYFSWITILSVAGLAIGVAVMIVVLSVFNGFEYEVKNRLLQANGHVVASVYPAGLNNPPKWIDILQNDSELGADIAALSPFIHTESLLKSGPSLLGVMVRGVDPAIQDKVQSLKGMILPSKATKILQKEIQTFAKTRKLPEVPSAIVGSGLLKSLNLEVGTTIQLVSPRMNSTATNARYRIVGTYNSGLKQYDDRLVVLSLPAAQAFTDMGDKVTGLVIGLKDAAKSTAFAERLAERYSALTVKEWQSMNRRFFELMDTERGRVGLIVALVGLVAGFNILTTVFVSVSQRQADISVLKALGATTPQVMKIFLVQSTAIGFIGALFGVILAGIITVIFKRYPLLELPDPYFLKTLPVQVSPLLYCVISLAAGFICLLAGLYPAWIASRVAPTEGIRGGGDAL